MTVEVRVLDVPMCLGIPATIVGTTAADSLDGTAGPDVIVGNGGHDVINGLEGDDVATSHEHRRRDGEVRDLAPLTIPADGAELGTVERHADLVVVAVAHFGSPVEDDLQAGRTTHRSRHGHVERRHTL